jgi:hypothetical protein
MFKRFRYLEPAETVIALRQALSLSQGDFARRLGVSRRTVIRGELRGLELPLGPWGSRGHIFTAWSELQAEAADRAELARSTKCHTPAEIAAVTLKPRSRAPAIAPSSNPRRLRLSADRLRDWKKRPRKTRQATRSGRGPLPRHGGKR